MIVFSVFKSDTNVGLLPERSKSLRKIQGRTSPSVKPSLMTIFHTAVEIPFSAAALSSGFSVPYSGSRICIPHKCPGRPLPVSSAAGFSDASRSRAAFRALHYVKAYIMWVM